MQTLFSLLRLALWGEPVALPPAIDWARVVREAEHQTVAGLLADAVGLLPDEERPPRDIRLRLAATAMRCERMHAQAERVLGRLAAEVGVRLVVMKGLSVGSRYREPRHRATGDIDLFYLSDADRQRADAWAKAHASELDVDNPMHLGFVYEGMHVESHAALREFSYPPYERAFRRIVKEARGAAWPRRDISGCEVGELPPTLYALFLLCHKADHLMGVGLGLRQVCDWAVFLRAERGNIDAERFQHWLAALGLERLAEAFGRVCVEGLGLPEASLPFTLRRDDDAGLQTVLAVMREGGNFGKTYYSGSPSFIRQGLIKMRHYARLRHLWPREATARYFTMVRNGLRRIKRGDVS